MNTNELNQIVQAATNSGFHFTSGQLSAASGAALALGHYALIQLKAFVEWWNQSGGMTGIKLKFRYGNNPPKP